MKKIVFLSLLSSALSWSAVNRESVKLDMKLSLNGKESSPQIIVNLGDKATLSTVEDNGHGYEISLRPNPVDDTVVAIEGSLRAIHPGRAEKTSHFTLLAKYGNASSLKEENKWQKLKIEITPTKEESLEEILDRTE